jgi:hypothetical protein
MECFHFLHRHSGASPTGPRKARPDGGEPGISLNNLWIPGSRAKGARPGMTTMV